MIQNLIQKQKVELKTAEDLESMCWTLWSAYWEFLMSDPEHDHFFDLEIYQSAHYTKKILEVRQQSFEVFVNYMVETGRMFGVSDLMDPEVIVSNIIDSTVSVAVKMHLGYMDKTALKARRRCYKQYLHYCSSFCILMCGTGEYKSSERLLFCTFPGIFFWT